MHISSLQNPRIKNIIKLTNRRQRDSQRRTLVEGTREVATYLATGLMPAEIYLCPELIQSAEEGQLGTQLEEMAAGGVPRYVVTPEVFAKIAYRGDSGGLLLVIPYLSHTLDELVRSRGREHVPFLVVVENVEKPGNLGAILRSADAAGIDGLIVATAQGAADAPRGTDLHNPNVVRASLGTLFSVAVAESDSRSALARLTAAGIAVIAATPDAATRYTDAVLTGPVAIVTGSEAHGLTSIWLEGATQRVSIPMVGKADSLNLATSTTLLLYEVVRQRGIGLSR